MPGTERLLGPVLRQPGAGPLRSAWSPDGRRLAAISDRYRRGLARVGADASGTRRAGRGCSGSATSRSCGRSPSAPTAPGWRRAGRKGSCGCSTRRMAGSAPPCSPGAQNVSGLAFSPDGRRLYAAGWGMGGVKVFDPARDPRGRGIPGWLDQIAALTFDREGLRILGIDWVGAACWPAADPVDGTVRIERVLPVTDSRRWPRGDFAFSRDGRRLAAPTRRDRTVVGVWDVALGRPVATLRGSGGPVTAVAFGPDGRSLASAAAGGPNGRPIVTLWHLASGRAIRTFEAGPDPVEALAFSGDGRRLAAGGGTSGRPGLGHRLGRGDGGRAGDPGPRGPGQVPGVPPGRGPARRRGLRGGEGPPLGPRRGHADHPSGAEGGQLRRVHPGREAAGGAGVRRQRPPRRRADRRRGARAPRLRPARRLGGFTPRLAFSPDGSRIAANAIGRS